LRFRILGILIIFSCILSGSAAFGAPVAVRYKAGLIHGFLVLSTMEGVPIAAGDLTQVARGDQVTIHAGDSGARLGEHRALESDDREISYGLFPARRVRG